MLFLGVLGIVDEELGDAEVDELEDARLLPQEEEILGLDVPMADVDGVQVLDGFDQLHEGVAGHLL